MMKKILFILAFVLFATTPAFCEESEDVETSKKIIVEAAEDISIDSKEVLKFKALQKIRIDNVGLFEDGDIIEARISEVVAPKRGKRNGYIILKPVYYMKNNVRYEFEDKTLSAKVVDYRPFDVKNAAMKAGVGVAGIFVKGLSQIFYLGQGMIKPEEGEGRIKSGFKNVYKNSPLVYVEEGKVAQFNKGDVLVLKFSSEED